MPRLRLLRKTGPLGLALMIWDVYRRLPPKQRRQVAAAARKHGPTVARNAAKLYSGYRKRG